MLRNKIGPVFNAGIGSFFCFFFFFYHLLSAGRTRFSKKNKKEKTKNLDQLLTLKKANIGPAFNSTSYAYKP